MRRYRQSSILVELFELLLAPVTWFLQSPMTEGEIRAFYRSPEWKRLRYAALVKHGRRCAACGAGPYEARIVVGHIRPVRTHPRLRLKLSNLQILCDPCNVGKGSHDRTDWRGTGSPG